MDDVDHEDEGESAGGGFQTEALKSYASFGMRAIRARKVLFFGVLLAGTALAVLVMIFFPKTYSCTTILMTVENRVLDGQTGANPLAGAADLVKRKENLAEIVESTGLVEKAAARRPPLLKLRDAISKVLFGELDRKSQVGALVGALESKVSVSEKSGSLDVTVTWADPASTAEIADAARESFLKARRNAEISAFEEKMSILDGHATTLRGDIDTLAQQLQTAREERAGKPSGDKDAKKPATAPAPAAAAPAQIPQRVFVRRPAEPDEQLPALVEKLDADKKKLAELETEHDRQVRDARAKFEEMKLRLTPMHPEVITQGERVAMLAQVPSDIAQLRAESADLEREIKQRKFSNQATVTGFGGAVTATKEGNAEPLPSEITQLLDKDNLDPALVAQLSGTVMKYGTLRDELLSARIDLDTAQAAFNHRYQLIVPAEVPAKPIKPKPALILAIGILMSALLGLILPIALELRTGIMIERWQVQAVQLPVLAELRLPPYSSE
jgi:hypothetical protein